MRVGCVFVIVGKEPQFFPAVFCAETRKAVDVSGAETISSTEKAPAAKTIRVNIPLG